MNEDCTFELDGDVALIGLNRPAKRNALNDAMVARLGELADRAAKEARAAVIFGNGDHFCAGLDLGEHSQKDLMSALEGSRSWHRAFEKIEQGGIPWVSALHGAVVGGGFELAASTHVRVAAPDAFFALPEGQRGIFVGGGGSVRIARLIGAARMADIMLTGRVIDAPTAEQWQAATYLAKDGDVRQTAIALAHRIAENAPFTNYAVVNALPRIQDMSRSDGLFMEAFVATFATAMPEAKQKLEDFLQKRAAKVAKPGSAKPEGNGQ